MYHNMCMQRLQKESRYFGCSIDWTCIYWHFDFRNKWINCVNSVQRESPVWWWHMDLLEQQRMNVSEWGCYMTESRRVQQMAQHLGLYKYICIVYCIFNVEHWPRLSIMEIKEMCFSMTSWCSDIFKCFRTLWGIGEGSPQLGISCGMWWCV